MILNFNFQLEQTPWKLSVSINQIMAPLRNRQTNRESERHKNKETNKNQYIISAFLKALPKRVLAKVAMIPIFSLPIENWPRQSTRSQPLPEINKQTKTNKQFNKQTNYIFLKDLTKESFGNSSNDPEFFLPIGTKAMEIVRVN